MVRDLEYFSAFLRCIKDGGRSEAEQKIRRLRLEFESDKDKATSKGRKLDEKKLRLESLVTECERLAYEIGIIEKPGVHYKIRTEDSDVTLLIKGDPSDQKFRASLLRRLLATYRSFTDLIFQIRAAPLGEICASHDRTGDNFQRSIKRYKLDMSQWTFEASRDLATQLGLINWRMLDPEEVLQDPILGKSGYLLYLTLTICRLSELKLQATSINSFSGLVKQNIQKCQEDLNVIRLLDEEAICQKANEYGIAYIKIPGDAILIRHKGVDEKCFEEALWHWYLNMTDRVPREPVYYCRLRDKVCEALRIQDRVFDRMINKMITQPDLFSVKASPGEGSLPTQRATSRKQIPPPLFSDSYMVYLKMEKVRSV